MSGDQQPLDHVLLDALGIDPEDCDQPQAMDSYRFALMLCWERMVPIVGAMGARAIVEHCIRRVSKNRPRVALLTVTHDGPDLSSMEAQPSEEDRREACIGLKELCVVVFQTLGDLTGDVLVPLLLREIRERQRGRRGPHPTSDPGQE